MDHFQLYPGARVSRLPGSRSIISLVASLGGGLATSLASATSWGALRRGAGGPPGQGGAGGGAGGQQGGGDRSGDRSLLRCHCGRHTFTNSFDLETPSEQTRKLFHNLWNFGIYGKKVFKFVEV